MEQNQLQDYLKDLQSFQFKSKKSLEPHQVGVCQPEESYARQGQQKSQISSQKSSQSKPKQEINSQNCQETKSKGFSDFEQGSEGPSDKIPMFIPFKKTEFQLKIDRLNEEIWAKKSIQTPIHTAVPWMSLETKAIHHPSVRFHNETVEFYNYIKPSEKEHSIRLECFQRIKEEVLACFAEEGLFDIEVLYFGSFATKLYLPDGDIDIAVLINPKSLQLSRLRQSQNESQKQQLPETELNKTKSVIKNAITLDRWKQLKRNKYSELYEALCRWFRNKKEKYYKAHLVMEAKVPLLKFSCMPNQIDIDIHIETEEERESLLLQIESVERIKGQYPEFVYLVFVFKCALNIREMDKTYTGGVGSFLLCCLVFHFLRQVHADKVGYYEIPLGEAIMRFMSFYFMDDELFKKVIFIESGKIKPKGFKSRCPQIISPIRDPSKNFREYDIGRKAYRFREILLTFKDRYKRLQDKYYHRSQSFLKELVNPTMKEFVFYQEKLPYFDVEPHCQNKLQKMMEALSEEQEQQDEENHSKNQDSKREKMLVKRKLKSVRPYRFNEISSSCSNSSVRLLNGEEEITDY